ncbi:Uncharacterised protein [Clostridium beijerinckii]|nr:Uncharacterised protein [Clostridium beijerinckii]
MQKIIKLFSTVLLSLFVLLSRSSCHTLIGEPDFPEELLK